jgi:hypothetical protein
MPAAIQFLLRTRGKTTLRVSAYDKAAVALGHLCALAVRRGAALIAAAACLVDRSAR